MSRKNRKTIQRPNLPGLPPGTFPLSPDEHAEFKTLNTEQRLLQAEADKLQLRQRNLFLQIQIRTGQNMEGWGVDVQRGVAMPPKPSSSPADVPQPPAASEDKPAEA